MNSTLSYDDFVAFVFDRPKNENGKKFFFREDFSEPDLSNTLAIEYICNIFNDITELAQRFSEWEIVVGLQYLMDGGCGGLCYAFVSDDVPIENRVTAISLMNEVFKGLFDKRCANVVDPSDLNTSSFNYLCLVWWDVFPRHGIPRSAQSEPIDRIILETISRILSLDNIMCKKSALRGLGLWHSEYSEEVALSIAGNSLNIPNCLQEYAHSAAHGDIK
ncbi:hypothetical protein FNU76_16790 [Chitinimonas arctica]|uniref:Uncharacterized protein n=1 Tax=Chitinimonas arctica TaxID=2594795 RepID=A0A516SI82_9NEIS|nr:hypothetical protein [Chitinimonas arctica]QDQ27869.1 hypothetical protein FNU76_16790 [Chitinimonas arctica]